MREYRLVLFALYLITYRYLLQQFERGHILIKMLRAQLQHMNANAMHIVKAKWFKWTGRK